MKRLGWLSALTVASMVASIGIAQPKLTVVGGTKFELGNVDRGQQAQRKLILKNTGSDTLVLGNVEVSCGCTGSVVSSSRIAPGKTGELMVTFNSGGFSGEVHKSLTLNSNAEGSPRTVIEFTANVIEDVVLNPRALYFRTSEVGKVDTFSVTVQNTGKEPITIVDFKTSLQGITLDIPKAPIAPGQTVRMAGEFKPTEPKGMITDNLAIHTTSKRQSEINIPLIGAVKEFQFK